MTDRLVQYPFRYLLTQVSEGVYDLTAQPGTIINEGTPINSALFDLYVEKETNKSLILNTLITKINELPDNAKLTIDLGNKVDKVSGKSLILDTLIAKINELYSKNEIDNTFQTKLSQTQLDNISDVPDKVDKVEGKGLSTNDFTNEYKTSVDNAVPNTRKINNKQLNDDITLDASDVGTYTQNDIDNKNNKTEFMLGYFDTYASGVVTRQTEYLKIEAKDIVSVGTGGGSNVFFAKVDLSYIDAFGTNDDELIGVCSNSNYSVKSVSPYWVGDMTIGIQNGESKISIGNSSFSTIEEFRALCPLYIQYKTATSSYQEPLEECHYSEVNKYYDYMINEAKRGVQLGDMSTLREGDGSYWNFAFKVENVIAGHKYSIMGEQSDSLAWIYGLDANYDNRVLLANPDYNYNMDTGYTFVVPTDISIDIAYIYVVVNFQHTSLDRYANTMFNEGNPLPYQPYEGKVVHENDLDSIKKDNPYTLIGSYSSASYDIDETNVQYLIIPTSVSGVVITVVAGLDNTNSITAYSGINIICIARSALNRNYSITMCYNGASIIEANDTRSAYERAYIRITGSFKLYQIN